MAAHWHNLKHPTVDTPMLQRSTKNESTRARMQASYTHTNTQTQPPALRQMDTACQVGAKAAFMDLEFTHSFCATTQGKAAHFTLQGNFSHSQRQRRHSTYPRTFHTSRQSSRQFQPAALSIAVRPNRERRPLLLLLLLVSVAPPPVHH